MLRSFIFSLVGTSVAFAATPAPSTFPIAAPDLVFAEHDGLVAGEAEHFTQQAHHTVRAWHRISTDFTPNVEPDGDPSHADTASNHAYIECLPDTRRSHDDPLVPTENFSNDPGAMAVISYRIHFQNPGRYYVWLRTFSTNTEDNGVHVGLDGEWPESGQRWQTTQKHAWSWDCRQRTPEVHVGIPLQLYLDVPTAGEHTFQISMREDGVEIDRWLLARDPDYRPESAGPPSRQVSPARR